MNRESRALVAGLILCGGRSSRMGSDKAALRFPGGPLLARVLGRMTPLASPIAISLAPGQTLPEGVLLPPGALIVRDGQPEQGPLWGLAEGFRALAPRAQRVVVMPVDMPFFTTAHMAQLVAGLEGYRACLYLEQGYRNALTAAYDLTLLDKVESLLAQGKRRPVFICEGEPTRELELPPIRAGQAHPLMDVDTPLAYREALLAEGVGSKGGAEVWVRMAGGGTPGGFALYAHRVRDAVAAAARLYPERLLPGDVEGRNTWEVFVNGPASGATPGALDDPLDGPSELTLTPRQV